MTKKTGRYEINEKDIETVLKILRQEDPNATPEMAIAVLEELQAGVHMLAHEDPETLLKIYRDLKKK